MIKKKSVIEPDKPIRVIYICSPVRSGSTFLQGLMSGHSDILALGELHRSLKILGSGDRENLSCTCGVKAESCDVWRELYFGVESENLDASLTRVLEVSGRSIILDSSKNINHIDFYVDNPRYDIFVINLVRDVRGWAFSIAQRKSLQKDRVGIFSLVTCFYQWAWTTNKRQRFLIANSIKHRTLFYEDLIFDTEETIEYLLKSVDVKISRDLGTTYKITNAHELLGNSKLKGSQRSSNSIVYDYGWFHSWRVVIAQVFSFPVMMYYFHIYTRKSKC